MSDEAPESDAFARIVQAAYHQVRQGTPRAIPEVEERLRGKLAAHGVTLTTDVVREGQGSLTVDCVAGAAQLSIAASTVASLMSTALLAVSRVRFFRSFANVRRCASASARSGSVSSSL